MFSEWIGKLKELWQPPRSLGMSHKTVISNFIATEDSNTLAHDTCSTLKIFKSFFSNMAKFLLIKLLKSPDKYNLKSVIQYYSI